MKQERTLASLSTSPLTFLHSHQPCPVHHPLMEITAPPPASFMEIAARAEIDTSRPFQSVREAVEVFGGERYYVGGGGGSRGSSESSSKFSVPAAPAPSSTTTLLACLRKVEADLAEARSELAQLKQRQSQMETAVSSITVQFSGGLAAISDLKKGKELAVVDAASSGAAAMIGSEEEEDSDGGRVRSDRWDEAHAEEWMASLEYLPSLSEALTIKMIEDDLGERRKVKKKNSKAKKQQHKKQKKNAASLVGGIFSRKDKSSS